MGICNTRHRGAGKLSDELVILDFETTGLSADYDRVIEVGAVIVRGGQIIDSFAQLMDPGQSIPPFITSLTGISPAMIKGQPSPKTVMPRLKTFMGNRPILAHNASFDRRFLHAEMARANLQVENPMLCSLLLSRRLLLDVKNHKLGTLAAYFNIETGRAHRALDDVKVTAEVWAQLRNKVVELSGVANPELAVFQAICKKPKAAVTAFLQGLNPGN